MDFDPPAIGISDTASVEYLDAESDAEHDLYHEAEEEQQKHSIICEIQQELNSLKVEENAIPSSTSASIGNQNKDLRASAESLSTTSLQTTDSCDDYMHDVVWRRHKKHIFILSEAGKPIYSLHGNEDKLATIFGVIQALVSFVQHGQDAITSIHAHGIKFVFLVRNSLILVAASRTNMSVPQLQMQLSDVYNQILSTLTYSQMSKIFEKRKNFDLRRLLAGSERLIYHLLSNDSTNKRVTNNVFTFLTNSICILPLPNATRSNIISAIQSNCSKIKNLVFAVLIAKNKLVALVRMKKYSIHPTDLRLILNLIEWSESFKNSENWTPICLPKFDMNGFLHAHVSYLADDCEACLLLLTVDPDAFFTLSEAKKRITEKLGRTRCLEAMSDEMNKNVNGKIDLAALGVPELRHFLYKPKNTAQILCSEIKPPYDTVEGFERLEAIYCDLLQRTHNTSRPLKLIYEVKEYEIVLVWMTASYELYAVFEPLVDKTVVIEQVNKLIKWIDKVYDVFFIRQHPTF